MNKETERKAQSQRNKNDRSEEILAHYLEKMPLSYSLWRSLEFQQLEKLDYPDPILDLGCGDGIFSSVLFGEVAGTVIGSDLNRGELILAKKHKLHDGTVNANARLMPFKDNSFGTVFSNCVLEHIPDVEKVIQEAHRVLRPGGVFIFTVPSEYFTANLLYVSLFRKLHLNFIGRAYGVFVNRILKHVNTYSAAEWEKLAVDSAFRIERKKIFVAPAAVAAFDFFMPLSLLSLLSRRITGRWTVFPAFRRLIAGPLFSWSKKFLRLGGEGGGCVLFVARKPE